MLATIQKILAWRFFSRREEPSGAVDIIKWWELRRIPYNLVVGTAGVITTAMCIAVAAIASEKFGEPLGMPDPPIFAIFAVIAYGIGANICFAGGWVVELFVRKLWRGRAGAFGEISFALGLLFSVLLTLVPAALFAALLILRLLFSK